MWEKDSCGNWYMDGSKVFSSEFQDPSVWDKDDSECWIRVPQSSEVSAAVA